MFTERANRVLPSSLVDLNARIAQMIRDGVDIVKLNIGEPDFDTPDNIKKAAIEAIETNFTRYTPTPGIVDLRKIICDRLMKDFGASYKPTEITVSTGAKQALFEAVMVLAEEGDEVLVPAPCWVSYEDMSKIAGAKPVLVPTKNNPEERFHLDLDAIEAAVTERTTAIMINSPNNPTGVVYNRKELEGLAALAEKYNFWIISDEVYEKLLYNGTEYVSMASVAPERSVVVNGCSKAYAMTGWRVGYAAAPLALSKKLQGLQGHITSGINAIAQKAACEAFGGPQDSVEAMRQQFAARLEMMYARLSVMPGITCDRPDGAFYLMPDITSYYGKSCNGKTIHDSRDMADYLLDEAGVAVAPGDSFHAPGFLRLSYSNSMENLSKALDRMEKALGNLT